MEAGALGTETTNAADDGLSVRGYFETAPDEQRVRDTLTEALKIYGHAFSSASAPAMSQIADRDWLAEWKKNWRPVEVGGFIITPPWIEPMPLARSEPPAVTDGQTPIIIRINPGMAFGTGTHETTRLCLKAIEKYFREGSFLDVGTGTGILAIAAAKLIPDARVEACDNDPDAIEIAKENAQLNDIADRILFRAGSVENETPSADLVCANLTAPVIVELLPALLGATCGRLVLSGILDSQIDMVQSRLLELGVVEVDIDQDGEWIALVV
jgi:ribosomal protein L11 methyltransferase